MAATRCPHCETGSFEIAVFEPVGGNFKQNFVQCTGCGAPFGVLDFYNLGPRLDEQQAQLDTIQAQLDSMQLQLVELLQAMSQGS